MCFLDNYLLIKTSLDEFNEVRVNTQSFSVFNEGLLEMIYQIQDDLRDLTDYSIDMDLTEQISFFERLLLGEVEEVNGYTVDFDRETWTYVRRDEYGRNLLELTLNIIK